MTCTHLWSDSLGNPVDLDDIDREYALNILCMVIYRRGVRGYTRDEVESSALVKKLREVVLHGREPNEDDIKRARKYNKLNSAAGLLFRASVHPRDGEPLDSEDGGETYENRADKDALHDEHDEPFDSVSDYKRWIGGVMHTGRKWWA